MTTQTNRGQDTLRISHPERLVLWRGTSRLGVRRPSAAPLLFSLIVAICVLYLLTK